MITWITLEMIAGNWREGPGCKKQKRGSIEANVTNMSTQKGHQGPDPAWNPLESMELSLQGFR